MSRAAENHLERAAPADQPGQPLRPAAAGNDPDRHLRLAEAGLVQRGVAHVEGHRELASSAAADALDDRDGRPAAGCGTVL